MTVLPQGVFHALLCVLVFMLQLLWMILPGPRASSGPDRSAADGCPARTERFFIVAAAFFLAFVAASLLHLYPLNGFQPIGDSAVFIYVGERMGEGLLPYRDLFDHKGPLLYVIEAAGCAMTPGKYTGLWILELLNLTVTLTLMLAVCSHLCRRRSSTVLAVMLAFVVCGRQLYEGGNLTEEYALPWIALGMLVFLRYFRTGVLHYREVLLLGVAFGAILLLRINMAALWLAWTPVTLVLLWRRGQKSAVPRCIGSFLLGMGMILAPFLLWMLVRGFLREFWACYVLFNFRYAEEVGGGVLYTLHLTGWMVKITLPAVPLLLLGLVREVRNPRYLACLLLVCVSAAAAMMSGRDYPHYLIILLPPLAAGFAPLFDLTADFWNRRETEKEPTIRRVLLTCAFLAVWTIGYHQFTAQEPIVNEAAVFLRNCTTTQDDVLVLGNNAWLYLDAERSTANRFFYQPPPIEISDELREAFLRELREKPSEVVVSADGDFAEASGDWRADVYDILTDSGYGYLYTSPYGFFFRSSGN